MSVYFLTQLPHTYYFKTKQHLFPKLDYSFIDRLQPVLPLRVRRVFNPANANVKVWYGRQGVGARGKNLSRMCHTLSRPSLFSSQNPRPISLPDFREKNGKQPGNRFKKTWLGYLWTTQLNSLRIANPCLLMGRHCLSPR